MLSRVYSWLQDALIPLRIDLAALLMLAVHFGRRGRARFQPRDFWTFAYMGFLGVVLNQGCFMVGLGYTTSGRSVLVKAVGPILILVLVFVPTGLFGRATPTKS